jgi:hypothetical protein
LGSQNLHGLGASNGRQDHTVLPYAATRLRQKASPGFGAVRPARCCSLTETALQTNVRADAAASTTSHPAFVTIAIRPSYRERTGRAGSADLPDGGSEIFFPEGLDDPNHVEITAQIKFYAQRIFRSFVIERRGVRTDLPRRANQLYEAANQF